ncbi:MAG: DMT family transporter [Ignavibacteria bacterium]|nr:DMT family transporter [Ignavibacteria bacterium]
MIGELSALATAILWSGTALAFSAASKRVGSMQVNTARLCFALVLLSVSVLALGLPMRIQTSQLWLLSVSGLIGLVFGDGFLFLAFEKNGARVSMLIMAINPAMTAVLAFFFLGESIAIAAVAGMALTVAGIALVVLDRRENIPGKRHASWSGILYAFFGALGQAVGLIFAKQAFMEGDIHAFVATFWRIAAAVAVMVPAAFIMRSSRHFVRAYARDRRALLLTGIGAVIGPYLGITFSLVAIANTKTAIAATIMATPPIIMLPMVRAISKERLHWKAVAGAFLAVAGVAILFLF